jgi:hypothetical protein
VAERVADAGRDKGVRVVDKLVPVARHALAVRVSQPVVMAQDAVRHRCCIVQVGAEDEYACQQ